MNRKKVIAISIIVIAIIIGGIFVIKRYVGKQESKQVIMTKTKSKYSEDVENLKKQLEYDSLEPSFNQKGIFTSALKDYKNKITTAETEEKKKKLIEEIKYIIDGYEQENIIDLDVLQFYKNIKNGNLK